MFEALHYAHTQLGLGTEQPAESEEEEPEEAGQREAERHLTGQQLCEAIRLYALEQYGYMAQDVLKSWGITSTGDFGEIVFNLIRVGQCAKPATTPARILTTSSTSTPGCGRVSKSPCLKAERDGRR